MDEVQQVKDRIDIVEVMGETLKLARAGKNFKALCPFHGEKSPSLVISPDRQIWHCFGCNKGGDVFTFLMEFDKIDFSEALKELAAKAGVTLSKPVYQTQAEQKKDVIFELNHLSANYYNYLLLSHPIGKNALTYLTNSRQLPIELIKKFNLGFAPTRDTGLVSYLTRKKDYAPEDIVNAGLATIRNGRLSDFFRNRVIFPIQDVRGNTIAFSGRVLSDTDGPKYINTRETQVYHKGDTLYGLFHAKDAIRAEKRVIIMEGEFDVLSSFKEGIANTVAVKGTALTESQIKLLKRFAEKVSFCFDTDSAGVEAQKRSIALIEKAGIVATIIVPPKGKDADELLRESPGQFKAALKHDINMYDYVIDEVVQEHNATTAEGKKKILENTLPLIAGIENEVVKEHYMRRLAELLNSSFEAVVRQADKIIRPRVEVAPEVAKREQTSDGQASERMELYLLSLLFQAKRVKEAFTISDPYIKDISLSSPVHTRLYEAASSHVVSGAEFDTGAFAQSLPKELVGTFDKACLAPLHAFAGENEYRAEIKRIAATLRTVTIKKALQNLTESIKKVEQEGDTQASRDQDLMHLNEEFNRLTQLLHKS
jgi:DNA primase